MNKNFQLFVPSTGSFMGIKVHLRRRYLLLYHQFSPFFTHSPSRPGVLSILVSWSSKMLQATQNAALEWICFVRCCLECSQPWKLLHLGVIWGFLGIFVLFLTLCGCGLKPSWWAPSIHFLSSAGFHWHWSCFGVYFRLCVLSYFYYLMHLLTLFWFCYGTSPFFSFYYFTQQFCSFKSAPKNSHPAFLCLDPPSHLSLQPFLHLLLSSHHLKRI